MKLFLLILFLGYCLVCSGQEAENGAIEQFIASLLEQYAAESEEVPDAESFFEELMALAAQPLALNSADREQLIRLPFLTDLQVENILYHRYTFGAFTSLYELQLVEGLDMTDIRRMLPFVSLGTPKVESTPLRWWEVKKYGRHDLYLRTDLIPETRRGYQSGTASYPVYAGDPLHSSLKYRFDYRDRIRLAITAEKDPGERWWNKGFDFMSASFQYRSPGWIKNLIIGDFTAGFGQGLVIRQGFYRSKSLQTTNLVSLDNGFKRAASTNEYQYFRGIAASFQLRKFKIHSFYSHRHPDATVGDGIIRSLYQTGLHRTETELQKQNQLTQHTAGINLCYAGPQLEWGVSAVYTRFSRSIEPLMEPYKYFYFSGDNQLTTGTHYRFSVHGIRFFGETAFTAWPAVGTVNGFSYSPASRISLSLVQRYYHRSFQPLFASSFSARQGVNDEKGIYFGMDVYPAARLKLAVYADSYRFSWMKFGIDAPSTGYDFLLYLLYTPDRDLQLSLKARHRQQYTSLRNGGLPVLVADRELKSSARLQCDYSAAAVQFRSSLELNRYEHAGSSSVGLGAWQDLSTQLPQLPLKISLRYCMFSIPTFDNRMYIYEKDVLHAFYTPSFSGKGSRYYLLVQYKFSEWLSLWCKLAQLRYADGRTTIGSGYEEITGTKRTEIHFLLRFRCRKL